MRLFLSLWVGTGLLCSIQTASADVFQVILTGKVQMEDGSPPPKQVAIQRVCTDGANAPGPLTDKKGNWLWRIDVDPMRSRVCRLQVNSAGYQSNSIDISALNGYTSASQTLPPLILYPAAPDPMSIVATETGIPGKSVASWKAALKAVGAGNLPEAESQLQASVAATPKFAQGWHTLAIVYSTDQKPKEAKDAWEHAIEADPKMLQPYVGLARLCVRIKDWPCATKAADGLLKVDSKKTFPEIYIHQAVARYATKDLAGAQTSAEEAIKLDLAHKRSEYILGRILEAKGDLAGAKEHMTKYVQAAPKAADIEQVKRHLDSLGKPEAAGSEPDLEAVL